MFGRRQRATHVFCRNFCTGQQVSRCKACLLPYRANFYAHAVRSKLPTTLVSPKRLASLWGVSLHAGQVKPRQVKISSLPLQVLFFLAYPKTQELKSRHSKNPIRNLLSQPTHSSNHTTRASIYFSPWFDFWWCVGDEPKERSQILNFPYPSVVWL